MKMKRLSMTTGVLMLIIMLFAACSGDSSNTPEPEERPNAAQGKNLVVYFSQIIPEGVDATTGATNIVREDGNDYGAAQYLAMMIARKTNADTLRLTVANGHYPVGYNDLAEFARNERDNNSHPTLTSRRVNMADYANIIVVTPIWWYTVPMPVYSFLYDYNLSGKNVYVVTTHAGSGLADAIAVLRREEPNANVSSEAFTITASQVSAGSSSRVDQWLNRIGLQ